MKTREMVFTTDFKTRAEEDGSKFVEGYFIRYNSETELWPGVFEEIKPEAVNASLTQNDVRCLFNHDSAFVLGRTGNNTLELKSDSNGLWGRVSINENDKAAMDVYARIQRGDINACSFGFIPLKERVENKDDGTTKFVVEEVDLIEVSAVTFPAYKDTSIAARKQDLEQCNKRALEVRKSKLKERLQNGSKTINA